MIRRRDPGNFGLVMSWFCQKSTHTLSADRISGPVVVSVLLFFAILANFVIRGKIPPHHLCYETIDDPFRLILSVREL